MTLQQRCWNHETREAVCRCPGCSRSFCRECVTEHESRLLCAACLAAAAHARQHHAGGPRKLRSAAIAFGGLFLAWLIFYGMGETMVLITRRIEQLTWKP